MSTLDQLKQLLDEKFGIDPATLDPAQPLIEYGLDSLSLAEFMFTIEEHFGIEFPSGQQDVDTLAALADLIDGLRVPLAA